MYDFRNYKDPDARTWTNERGNRIVSDNIGGDRYRFDFRLCTHEDGWVQYDTEQDASYFGVWVHEKERLIVTFAEGDLIITDCPTPETFAAEMAHACAFYGPPPPAFVSIGDGMVTQHYSEEGMFGRTVPGLDA